MWSQYEKHTKENNFEKKILIDNDFGKYHVSRTTFYKTADEILRYIDMTVQTRG